MPSRPGYDFLGWYDEINGGYVRADTPVTGSATYTARWQVKSYTVQFSDGVGGNSYKTRRYGEELGALPVPEREGYTFLGWFASDEMATEKTLVAGPSTYYARWKAEGCMLTFDYNTPNGQI